MLFCTECATPGREAEGHPSLDDRYPLMWCNGPCGTRKRTKGSTEVVFWPVLRVGSYDREEAQRLSAAFADSEAKRRRIAAANRRHQVLPGSVIPGNDGLELS